MYISGLTLFFAILAIIYFSWMYQKMRKLATYMKDIHREKDMLLFMLCEDPHKRSRLAKTLKEIFPLYTEDIYSIYVKTGPFNDGSRQYLYAMLKAGSLHNFTCITLVRFVNHYLNSAEHLDDLTDYRDGKRYKNELCKNIDELYLCLAKECVKIKNINKIYPIFIENIERYVASETI